MSTPIDRKLPSAPRRMHDNPTALRTIPRPPLPLTATPTVLLMGMGHGSGLSSNAVAGRDAGCLQLSCTVRLGVNVFTVAKDLELQTIRTVEVLDS
jgi:hypothetical protein